MIITCKECESSFNIDDGLIKEAGSKVKCSKCSNVFVVYPEAPADESDSEDLFSDLQEEDEDQDLFREEDFDDEDLDLPELDEVFGEDDDQDLGELEFDNDEDLDQQAHASRPETLDEEDLPDLDDMMEFDEDTASEDLPTDLTEELELDLDAELESEESDEVEKFSSETDETELDLLDAENFLDEDQEAEDEDLTAESDDELELDFDLADLDTESEETETVAGQSDELDLSDLEGLIDSDEASVAEETAEGQGDELDLDLDLDAADTEAEADELDLSDFEDIVEEEAQSGSEKISAEPSEAAEQDLELDFEIEDDAVAESAEVSDGGGDELDFSDFGEMLVEDEKTTSETADAEGTQELDLDFEVDLEPETAAQEPAEDLLAAGDDDEFLDIEKMLEESDEAVPGIGPDEDITDLDLDLEGELQEQGVADLVETADDDLEFNLLDSDVAALQESAADLDSADFGSESSTTGVMASTTDGFGTEEFTDSRDIYGATELIDDEMAAEMPKPPTRPSRSRKPVLAVVVVLILLGGLLIIPQNLGLKIPFLSDLKIPFISDIKIPFLAERFAAKPQDTAGNLLMAPVGDSITSQFIDNVQAGTLFVIKGGIKNEYDHPRSFIKVTAKLFQKGNVLAKSNTVYGGNILSQNELANLNLAVINKRLQNRFGNKKANIKVASGNVVPFMIVFDKLPDNLDEYTVEVAGSSL